MSKKKKAKDVFLDERTGPDADRALAEAVARVGPPKDVLVVRTPAYLVCEGCGGPIANGDRRTHDEKGGQLVLALCGRCSRGSNA